MTAQYCPHGYVKPTDVCNECLINERDALQNRLDRIAKVMQRVIACYCFAVRENKCAYCQIRAVLKGK